MQLFRFWQWFYNLHLKRCLCTKNHLILQEIIDFSLFIRVFLCIVPWHCVFLTHCLIQARTKCIRTSLWKVELSSRRASFSLDTLENNSLRVKMSEQLDRNGKKCVHAILYERSAFTRNTKVSILWSCKSTFVLVNRLIQLCR